MTYLKDLINQQFIISKLKKEAKIFKQNNPQYNLMQSQDIIAQQHGFLHWHELHTNIKNKLQLLNSSHLFSLNKNNNLFLGYDDDLKENIYLNHEFRKIHIQNNNYSKDNLFNIYKQTTHQHSRFIYCKTGLDNNLSLEKELIDHANKNNINVHHLSFLTPTSSDNFKNLSINFNSVSSGFLTELLYKLILDFEDDDAIVWKGRAISMISSIMMALIYMREKEKFKLTPQSIRKSLILDNVIALYHKNFPPHIHLALKSYLFSLPGFQEYAPKQNDTVLEHHGYLQMQFIRALGIMCDIYPHIFNNNPYSLNHVLSKNEKSLLIIHFPNFETSTQELIQLFNIFNNFLIHSFINYVFDKSFLNLHTYVLYENISTSFELPIKLIGLPIHFISLDKHKEINSITFSDKNKLIIN